MIDIWFAFIDWEQTVLGQTISEAILFFVIAKYSARHTSIVLFISHWVVKCLPHRTFWGAYLVIWFYHVRKRIFIDLKFRWGFEVHTKRLVYIYISWLLATLSAPSYNPNCLMCMYSNAASLLNPLILSPKESVRVYKQKQENLAWVLTNLVIFMKPLQRQMGLWAFTCTRDVTHQFHHQIVG